MMTIATSFNEKPNNIEVPLIKLILKVNRTNLNLKNVIKSICYNKKAIKLDHRDIAFYEFFSRVLRRTRLKNILLFIVRLFFFKKITFWKINLEKLKIYKDLAIDNNKTYIRRSI
jgi:hypothetical protein